MKYENAADILPEELLEQVQKYTQGRLVYIPRRDERKAWGERSGYKLKLARRNQMIRNMFIFGNTVGELAENYFLSEETIKRIVYSKNKEEHMAYKGTVTSAKEYARQGMLEEWIHTYLLFDRKNKGFSDGLKFFERIYIGPLKMPTNLFVRNCGPEEGMKWQVDGQMFEERVSNMMKALQKGEELPPLIINFVDEGFEMNDGTYQFEALKRLGIEVCETIIWITEKKDYDYFKVHYKQYMEEDDK